MFELKKSRHQVKGEFVEVNCATLHGDGAASTLFGHKKGAFTGAAADRAGLLRTAHEGVLFLDEIGELGADEQAMLLKAVEEKRFFPMGSDREVTSDFQLIAGTNRDLRVDVAAGPLSRGPVRAHQPVGLHAARPGATPGGPRAQHRAPAGACSRRDRPRGALQRRGQGPVPALRAIGRCAVERQLPRPVGQRHAPGHAGRRRAHLSRAGRRRSAAAALAVATQRTRHGGTDGIGLDSACSAEERLAELDLFDRMQLEAVVRRVPRGANTVGGRPQAVRSLSHAAHGGQRRRPAAQVPAEVWTELGVDRLA